MTDNSLHRPPRPSRVFVAQLNAVRIAIRKESLVFAIVCLVLLASVMRAAFASTDKAQPYVTMSFSAAAGIPLVIIALMIPFSVWRSEEPARRAYHWSMPVSRFPHTLIKVFAGLCWMLVAVAAYLANFALMAAAIEAITGRASSYRAPVWEWLVPFSAVTIAYLFGSAMVVGLRRPVRWILALVPSGVMLTLFADVVGLGGFPRAMRTLWMGEYGLATAFGLSLMNASGVASLSRWGLAAAMWGASVVVLLVLAAHRYFESSGD